MDRCLAAGNRRHSWDAVSLKQAKVEINARSASLVWSKRGVFHWAPRPGSEGLMAMDSQ